MPSAFCLLPSALAADYSIIVGAGSPNYRPNFDGAEVDVSTVTTAATSEGDTINVWGTFQEDGFPMDGLIWASVSDTSGAKSLVVFHDRPLYWSSQTNRPTSLSGGPVVLPTYGAWQTLYTLREAPSYGGQATGSIVQWLSEDMVHHYFLDLWSFVVGALGVSNDLSSVDGGNDMTGTFVGDSGLVDVYKFPDDTSGAGYGAPYGTENAYSSASFLVLGMLVGCPAGGACSSGDTRPRNELDITCDNNPIAAQPCATGLMVCDRGRWGCQMGPLPPGGVDTSDCDNPAGAATDYEVVWH